MDTIIPFYSNTPDNTHCFQAAIRMLAKYHWPDKEYTWEDLDQYTAKAKGLWTWPMAGTLWLQSNGLEVIDIETFDYGKFVVDKEDYLLAFYGPEAGREQIKHSDLAREYGFAMQFIEKVAIQNRIPTITDIINLLDQKYLLIACLNAQTLNQKPGYVGHFVVIKGYDENQLYLNDPGLPAFENRKVNKKLFEKAWAYPDEGVKNILAFR